MPELQLDADTLNVTAKIKILGKKTVLTQDQHNQEQFNVIAGEYIDASVRPRAIALDSVSNKRIIGKLFANISLDMLLGIATKTTTEGKKIFLTTQGTVEDSGLTGGSLDQSVYLDATGHLSLTPSICKVGYLIKTAAPTVMLNIGTESSNVDLAVAFDSIPRPYVTNPNLLSAFEKIKRDFEMDFSDVVSLPIGQTYYSIATDGLGMIVAVGYGGSQPPKRIIYSSNYGLTWNDATIIGGLGYELNVWQNVFFTNGLFIASGLNGNKNIATSTDGITWTGQTTPNALNCNFSKTVYGNSTYVAINQTTQASLTSPDGINWTENVLPGGYSFSDIAFGAGLFVIVSSDVSGGVATSPDGIMWTMRVPSEATQWRTVEFVNNRFVALSEGNGSPVDYGMQSTDGITWSGIKINPSTVGLTLAFGQNCYIAGDGNSFSIVDSEPSLALQEKFVYNLVNLKKIIFSNDMIFALDGSSLHRILFNAV
jgi:hypothetical protein